jgi:hypothetical protein
MKKLFKISISALTILLVFGLAVVSSYFNANHSPSTILYEKETTVSKHYPLSHKKAIENSRLSAVKIVSVSMDSLYLSFSSGTYFTAFDRYFVVTVHHGLQGPCSLTQIYHNGHYYDCKQYIKIDPENDYAIIEVGRLPEREPIKIPRDMPKKNQWKQAYSILNEVVYTGYPNSIGPLTLKGHVIGYASRTYLYIFSYAYAGASGAGVFSKEGKYIGYIIAIDVGETEFGMDVLENVILVGPSFNIDWASTLDVPPLPDATTK